MQVQVIPSKHNLLEIYFDVASEFVRSHIQVKSYTTNHMLQHLKNQLI